MSGVTPSSASFDAAFFDADSKLHGDDAVAALLVLQDGHYVMQLRDTLPRIFYPGHWGCFGGAVNSGEDPVDALKREIEEELEYRLTAATEFTRFDFDFAPLGANQKRVYRIYYEVAVPPEAFRHFVLHEGAEFGAFDGRDLLKNCRVTPYDAFAVWLHMSRQRFVGTR